MPTKKEDQQEKYDQLALYTLQKGDPEFIHQYVVDAFAAQNADENTKPITVYFALMGLYLHLEKNYTGREVQLAHMQAAKRHESDGEEWPKFILPKETSNNINNIKESIKVGDVLEAQLGPERDEMINKWSASVWNAWQESQDEVRKLTQSELGL